MAVGLRVWLFYSASTNEHPATMRKTWRWLLTVGKTPSVADPVGGDAASSFS
ncbi:MAG: hypothetical protein ACLSHC_17780 [Bilophila wadsworthia]